MLKCCLLMCLFRVISPDLISQPRSSVMVQLGKSATLECTIEQKHLSHLVWYKQVIAQAPSCILSSFGHSNLFTLYEGLKDTRFVMQKNGTRFNLHISKVEFSDIATYYCGAIRYTDLKFGNGTILLVKDDEARIWPVLSTLSKSLQSGDNTDKWCVMYRQTHTGNPNVSWFGHLLGQPFTQLTFTQGIVFQRSSEAGLPTQSCIYDLPKSNLSHSEAGIYYCAVATCGEIVFGNGTLHDEAHESACEHVAHSSSQHTQPDSSQHRNEETSTVTYASLEFKHIRTGMGHRRRELNKDTIYSNFMFQQWE
ncbi:uncharacterized protein [Lepisosteus oculatus]|uniref:uncharacterized protein isoform X2 n=1 Tax=Lepisosteus oculatus TaxID=7918 RepID=UPI00073FAF2B|nr:PREDICTED: uncharacterized protein LOC102698036 isoform X2 [Lepisosteus oculatus]